MPLVSTMLTINPYWISQDITSIFAYCRVGTISYWLEKEHKTPRHYLSFPVGSFLDFPIFNRSGNAGFDITYTKPANCSLQPNVNFGSVLSQTLHLRMMVSTGNCDAIYFDSLAVYRKVDDFLRGYAAVCLLRPKANYCLRPLVRQGGRLIAFSLVL